MDSSTTGGLLRGEKIPLCSFSTQTLKPNHHPRTPRFFAPQPPKSRKSMVIRASHPTSNRSPIGTHFTGMIRTTAGALILTATTTAALLSGKFAPPPARAESPNLPPAAEESNIEETESGTEFSALSQFLESNSNAVEALRSLLYQKLEDGEDAEALKILKRLMAAQPSEMEWKFLTARLLNEMGEVADSRKLFEEILSTDPFSFMALFENAVLMDRCGEGDAVIGRLERALEKATEERKDKESRDVRLIMAQIQFLQKKVDEALTSYEELAREDPKDYRPYFCQGVIYSLLDQNNEAREKFAKYKELSPRKFEVEGFLQTQLSRVKLFGVEASEI